MSNPFPDDWDEPLAEEIEHWCESHRIEYTGDQCPGCLAHEIAERDEEMDRDERDWEKKHGKA